VRRSRRRRWRRLLAEVLVAGHICIDLFPRFARAPKIIPGRLMEVGALRFAPGGCVANTGFALAGLGADVRMAADAGDDTLGRILADSLAHSGVAADLQLRPDMSTSYSIVIQPPLGDRTFWHHAGANESFDGSELSWGGAGILHVGYPPLLPGLYRDGPGRLRQLFRSAHSAGLVTSLDMATVDPATAAGQVNWKAWLDDVLTETDVFTPSIDDLTLALGRVRLARTPRAVGGLADGFIRAGAAIVMIKLGDRGLYMRTSGAGRLARVALPDLARWAERSLWAPRLQVDVGSTTGAGDSAAGGLLYGLAARLEPEETLLVAAAAAAARVESGSVPPWAELEERVRRGWRHAAFGERGWTEARPGVYRLEDVA
jgi:sugar/nucleoside kinase (ribokinase family)